MTEKQAYIDTIKHWREDYKKLRLFGGEDTFHDVFNGGNCALCLYTSGCAACSLRNCSRPDAPYSRACAADRAGDKPAFMSARSALLKCLERALERLK